MFQRFTCTNSGILSTSMTLPIVFLDALALTPCYSTFLTTANVPKKALPKDDRGKGIKLLSDSALLEEAQLMKTLKKSKQEINKLQVSGSSEGANFESEVPDESKAKSLTQMKELVSENDYDSCNDAQNSKTIDSDEEENPNLNLNINEEEEMQEKEYIHTTDYFVPTDEEADDKNMKFDDEEYNDAHVTLTTSPKTEGSK
nr:hypothetical protein [Tanacetum cinerariifolium]